MVFSPPSPARPDDSAALSASAGMKWAALHDAAVVVATLAGVDDELPPTDIRDFPAMVRSAAPWRREIAEKGIDDLAAIMEPGISALLAVHARGSDPRPPALALWREFDAARTALFALALPAAA